MKNIKTKICSKCKKRKDVKLFSKNPKLLCGYNSWCKQCENDQAKKWYWNNRHKVLKKSKDLKFQQERLNYGLLYRYNISLEKYNELLKKQNSVCAICKNSESSKHQNGKIKRLSVDHDHRTERIRGLLCMNCNIAIGKLNEDIKLFQKAIDYLS